MWQSNRVLHNFSNFAGSIVTIVASVLAIRTPGMDAGAVGLTVTYAREFMQVLERQSQWLMASPIHRLCVVDRADVRRRGNDDELGRAGR